MSGQHPLQLEFGPVLLREFREGDRAAVHAIVGDERVTQTLSFSTKTRAESDEMLGGILARAQADPRQEFYLAVTVPPSDEVIGFARLAVNQGGLAAELGYAIAAPHWRRGFGVAAASALVDFGFTFLGVHRITAAVGPDSAASRNLLKRLGFVEEGRMRDHICKEGQWRDSIGYSLLEHEWHPPATPRPPTPTQQARAHRTTPPQPRAMNK